MRMKLYALGLSALTLLLFVPPVSAGVIRDTGKAIGDGTVAVAQTTANAAGAAVDVVAEKTPGAVKTGAANVGEGAAQIGKGAAGIAVGAGQGTAKVAKKVWKAVW